MKNATYAADILLNKYPNDQVQKMFVLKEQLKAVLTQLREELEKAEVKKKWDKTAYHIKVRLSTD